MAFDQRDSFGQARSFDLENVDACAKATHFNLHGVASFGDVPMHLLCNC